ncbi:MAG: Ig-like domain-containing protein [Bacteroidaceae bacterium]|nr:Ig-like domain-containing protein [Bacteroidaceae bacterium]MBQ9295106.1 Ig-like domain-containing protein [Bacteroidaceae bacterium]
MKTKHILAGSVLLLLAACASIGSPDGGIFDEIPPKVVATYPAERSTGNNVRKMQIRFNEYIKLENANEKVIVSPPQIEPANIRADGKSVKITLYDTLQANTTYTIDFSDAIVDNNEGNPMGYYTYSFSTGEEIDTMEVAGAVLNAADMEPVKGMLVGLYSLDSLYNDSILRNKPFSRVSRTNGSGRFCIKGIKPGKYRAFALEDKDGDFIFSQKSERIAFLQDTITTSCKWDVRMDTIWRDSTHFDSIRVVPYVHYFPDNLVLNAFLESGQDQHLLKMERPDPDVLKLFFTAPADTLPTIKGINFDEKCLVADASLHNDTITYWITDTAFTHREDTMRFELTFLETDTLGVLRPSTELKEVAPKVTWDKILKEKQKKVHEWQKQREKRQKRSKEPLPPEDPPYDQSFLEISVKPSGNLEPNQNVHYIAKQPIARVDTTRMHLYIKQDSFWIPEPFLFLPDRDIKSYTLYAEWEQKRQYRFSIDSAAVVGVMGDPCKAIKNDFTIRSEDEFGSLFVHVILPDTAQVIVQLMNKSDKCVASLPAQKNGRADFFFLKPAEYYLRCFVDTDGNGEWSTGEYNQGLQPEQVFYFPKPIHVKAKWDIEQDWAPLEISRRLQKPAEITKQKPDKQKSVKERNKEREQKKQQEKRK